MGDQMDRDPTEDKLDLAAEEFTYTITSSLVTNEL